MREAVDVEAEHEWQVVTRCKIRAVRIVMQSLALVDCHGPSADRCLIVSRSASPKRSPFLLDHAYTRSKFTCSRTTLEVDGLVVSCHGGFLEG